MARVYGKIFLCAILLSGQVSADSGDILTTEQAYQRVQAKLVGRGIPATFVQQAFFDSRTALDPVTLKKLGGRGPINSARANFYQERVKRGVAFCLAHRELVQAIQRRFSVNMLIVLSIIGIETNYGAFMGTHDVFNVFYTQIVAIPARRAWAVTELAELVRYCYLRAIDPHLIKGSYAGAFGYGQFIPSSFNRYGLAVDASKLPRHDSWADTCASIINYLKIHGYQETEQSIRKALYAYNHSHVYVDTVIHLANLLWQALQAARSSHR